MFTVSNVSSTQFIEIIYLGSIRELLDSYDVFNIPLTLG